MHSSGKRSPAMAALAPAAVIGALVAFQPAAAGNAPWLINEETVAEITPLELKMGYYADAPGTRIGIAALYNDGSQNVLDVFDVTVDATGMVSSTRFESIDSGQVFGLGEICVGSSYFLAPYIKDFNIHVLRWDGNGTETQPVDTSSTTHTNTDCIKLSASYRIASMNFDIGRMEYFESTDSGLNWSLGVTYSPGGDTLIGPFSEGFRPKSGSLQIGTGEAIGTIYQRSSGPLEAVALDPEDGTVLVSVDFDTFAEHAQFIDNGYLKECDGRIIHGYPFGICNGGNAIGLGWIDPSSGLPGFELLNEVQTGSELSFQGLSLSYNLTSDTLFVHTFSNRHVRVRWNLADSSRVIEQIPDYPYTDIGGPVAAVSGAGRLYVAGAGFPSGGAPDPVLSLATMDPDPTVMIGQPLGAPGGPVGGVSVPVLGPGALILLALLVLIVAAAGRVWPR